MNLKVPASMAEQMQLKCVSCETTFDPAPNGGFCPDCDTPHPDFGQSDTPDEDDDTASVDAEAEAEESTDTADDSTDELTYEEESDASDEADAADVPDGDDDPDAEAAVCPECGAPLDDDAADDAEVADEADAADEADSVDEADVADDTDGPDEEDAADEADAADDEEDADGEPTESLDDDADDAAAEDGASDADEADDGDSEDDASEPDADDDAKTVTLLVDGEPYEFGDGDTFGRQDEAWLEDLVNAAGGPDDVAYVSGEHLEFSIDDDGVTVSDNGRNGTLLNGEDMDGGEATLEDGDSLELAERVEVEVSL